MVLQSKEVKELFDEFNALISNSQNVAIFTRDIDLQNGELKILNNFIEKAEKLKKENREIYTESELNLILCLIISADTIKSELNMLINLKEGNMDAAWACLVRAQYQTAIVANNHPFSDGKYLHGYLSKLDAYEKILFPKMMFASTGGIIKETKCSICHKDYEECDHLKGKMYGGELCVREIHEIDLEEVSLVENPANKLCRIISTERNGKSVDILTLKEKTK